KRPQSFFKIVTVIPGPCGMFRRDVLDEVAAATPVHELTGRPSHPDHGPYPYGTLAEDLDVTFTLLRWCWLEGWHGGIVYEPTAVVKTDGRHNLKDLFRQRYRWMRGSLTSTVNHFRECVRGLDGKTRRR